MTDRILTSADLLEPQTRASLFDVRHAERALRARIDVFDARVDDLLELPGPPSDEHIAEVDVLCAAIAELGELLDELRGETAAGRR